MVITLEPRIFLILDCNWLLNVEFNKRYVSKYFISDQETMTYGWIQITYGWVVYG